MHVGSCVVSRRLGSTCSPAHAEEQACFASVALEETMGHENDATIFQHDSRNDIVMVDAPETALGSIPLDEVDESHTFQEEMVSWDCASSFLPTFSSMDQVEMVNAPETALGSIPLDEIVSNHVHELMTT